VAGIGVLFRLNIFISSQDTSLLSLAAADGCMHDAMAGGNILEWAKEKIIRASGEKCHVLKSA
jgi:hypothetical protein